MGLHLVEITPADRERFNLGNVQGVLIDRVDPHTQAADVDLEQGDVIERVGGKVAQSPEKVMAQLAYDRPDSDNQVAVLVRTKSGPKWIRLWVGRSGSRDFVNGGFSAAANPVTRDASAPR